MKVNEFHPSGTSIKTCYIKRTLAGYHSLTIKPLATPPSSKDIKNWVRAKKYLAEKNNIDNVKSHKRNKEDASNIQQNIQQPSVDEKKELQRETSTDSLSNNSDRRESDSLILQQSVLSEMSDKTRKSEFMQNSNNLQTSRVSLNPSLQKALENPLLYKENKTQLGVSYGQIECSSKGSYGNASNENLQNARTITVVSL
jgi:type IV secretory pathway VirD2 relaxase